MDKEQTVRYIITYLGVPQERQEHVGSIIRGAYDIFPTMLELIHHVRECIEQDYNEKDTEETN